MRYKPTPNPMLVCIDFDGVICDSKRPFFDVATTVQKTVGSGRAPTFKDFDAIEDLTIRGFGALIGIQSDKLNDWASEVTELIKLRWPEVPVFDDIGEVLRIISQTCTIVIITSNLKSVVECMLEREDLSDTVKKIYDESPSKPITKTNRIVIAARKFKAEPGSVYMIGDTRGDIRHGKKAGAKTVAVTYGYQLEKTLRLESPHVVAKRPIEILRCLGL